MGMFDWVKYEMSCPNCGEIVKGFQSKDGICALRWVCLELIKLNQMMWVWRSSPGLAHQEGEGRWGFNL